MQDTFEIIQLHAPDNAESLESAFGKMTSVYANVYMEIGLQTGLILAAQIQNIKN